MSASEERVLGRLFLGFFVLCRLLPLPVLWEGDEDFPFLDCRRRFRPGLEDVEDLLCMEEGAAILLMLLFFLADDGLMDIFDTLSRLGFLEGNKSEEEKELFISSPLSFPPPATKPSESGGGDFGEGDNGCRYVESARSFLVIGAADGRIPILAAVCLPPELEVPPVVPLKVSSPFKRVATYLVLKTLLSPQILVTLLTFSTNL